LFLTEPENFGWLAHKYAYIYTYYKPQNQPVKRQK
jgi:hypothetical protein